VEGLLSTLHPPPSTLPVLSASLYGLALARYLFESQPQRFSIFNTWPGTLLLALVCGAVAWLITKRIQAALAAFIPLWLPAISLVLPDVNLLRAETLLVGALALFLILLFTPTQPRLRAIGDFTDGAQAGSGMGSPPHLVISLAPPFLLFCFLFALYLRTLAPAVGEADTFEFQVDIARLGIAHGSGYPLLMLLGKLFTWLPLGGTFAFRANVTSAFFGALAGVGVERLARRLGATSFSALLAGFAFGVSPTLWSRAVEVEAYTLNAALVAAILYLCLEIANKDSSYFVFRIPYSVVLAFLFGLSLTNHLTTLLLVPACLVAGGWGLGARAWGKILRPSSFVLRPSSHAVVLRLPPSSVLRPPSFVILSFLLGLSLYLYLPLRWPAVNHGELLSVARFINIVSGGEAKGAFQPALPFTDLTRYEIVFRKIVSEYTWIGLVLGLIGFMALVFRKRTSAESQPGWPMALSLALAYSGYLYFALAFNVPDPDYSAFFIPIHLITAVLMALGLTALLNLHVSFPWALGLGPWAFIFRPAKRSFVLRLSSFILLPSSFILPLHSLWLTLPRVDHSQNWDQYRLGQYILSRPLEPGATILADSQKIAPLYYLQVAEGIRPDLDIIVLPDEDSYRAVLDEHLAAGKVVYLGRYLPGLGGSYSLRSVGPLAQVSTQPFIQSVEVSQPLSMTSNANIQLIGYNAETLRLAAPDPFHLTLFWRAQTPPTDNLLVNLRLVDSSGKAIWHSAGSVPVGSLYPTNAWRPGEVISDFYSVPSFGASLAPGNYRLDVGLFPPFQVPATSDWVAVTPITLLPPKTPPTPPHLLRAQFGQQWLMGYAAPESAAPGSPLTITLYWLRAEENTTVTAFGETRSLAAWPVGASVPQVYTLTAPTTGDHFDLSIKSGEKAHCGWLAQATESCPLTSIQLTGEALSEGAVNFDNQLLLTSAEIASPTATPGGRAEIMLRWQSLRTMTEDYTVFVHLLGPDGQVHGQVDAWPVSGTLATSQWTPGEIITDHYSVPIPSDAPAGDYQVEIGLYLLATLERLPLLNAEGTPVDDRLLITGLTVDGGR